jgi:hypothetical protein
VGDCRFLCGERSIPARLLAADGETSLEWEVASPVPPGRWTVALFGPVGRFHIEVQTTGGSGRVETSYPSEVAAVRFRRDPRVAAPPGSTLEGPEMLAAIILDLSDRGVSFVVQRGQATLAPGSDFEATVRLNATTVSLRVAVRNVTELDGRVRVGATAEPLTAGDRARWYACIDALRHPLTRTGSATGAAIWDLFEAAGYLGLSNKRPADFDSERDSFDRACATMAENPQLGVQVVLPSPRGLESTISALAEFSETAVLYHMARRPGQDPRGVTPKTILRDSYEHAISWIARSGLGLLSVWVQDVTRFACGTHRDFAMAHANGYDGCVFSFRALEIQARAGAAIPEGWEVRPATADELLQVLDRFAAHFPAPLPRARAWDTTLLHPAPAAKPGVRRERAVLVATRGGEIDAAAILENMPAGMHLFGIFDTCHVVRFGRGGDGIPALLSGASDWYARLGKKHFIYACEDPAEPLPGARDLGLTHDTIIRTDHLGEFLEHVWHMTA